MAAVYVANIISRAMCSKRINVIGLNSCLNVKNTVYAPYYALLRTRLKVNIENHSSCCCAPNVSTEIA